MAPIPLQRDTVQRPGTTCAGHVHGPRLASRTSLPGIPLAPSAARRFVRAALAEWTGIGVPAAVGFSDRLADDAVTVTNELVTNAVVHADPGPLRERRPHEPAGGGRGERYAGQAGAAGQARAVHVPGTGGAGTLHGVPLQGNGRHGAAPTVRRHRQSDRRAAAISTELPKWAENRA
ncbi:ATP-binding protein, partial [Streptomyces griseus]|uniref:ATP-binding protein n=1 Tax=Streptomyces griseus TaxID=1911 RepID=UPI0034E58D48